MAVTLARLIREARLRLDRMSQGELARAVGCTGENITAIENSRNRQPSPRLIASLSSALQLPVGDLYSAIAGTLQWLPWERSGELDYKDPELELMFRRLDGMPDGETKERVKAFIRFTLEEERRERMRELEK